MIKACLIVINCSMKRLNNFSLFVLLGFCPIPFNHLAQTKSYSENKDLNSGRLLPDSLVAMVFENGKCGYINSNGDYIIGPKYEFAGHFSEGLAYVSNNHNSLSGFTDINDKLVLSDLPLYKNIPYFYNGIAIVEFSRNNVGCINKKGEKLFDGFYALGDYRDGLMKATKKLSPDETIYGYVDITGEWVIQFSDKCAVTDFTGGLASVKFDNQLWGVIDTRGGTVIEPVYKAIGTFYDGVALAVVGKEYKYINRLGQTVIDRNYLSGTSFFEGYAIVVNQQYKQQVINTSGEILSTFSFKANLTGVSSGLMHWRENGNIKFIDPQKNVAFTVNESVVKPHYSVINNYVVVEKDDLFGYMNNKGEIIVYPKFEECGDFRKLSESNLLLLNHW